MCLTDLFWWRQSWGQWPQLLQVFVGFFSQLVGVVLELLATEEHKNCYDLTLYWWHTLPEILITRPVLTACLGALRFPVSYPVGRGYFLSDQLQRKETIWVQHAAPGFMMCVQECECVREREMAECWTQNLQFWLIFWMLELQVWMRLLKSHGWDQLLSSLILDILAVSLPVRHTQGT